VSRSFRDKSSRARGDTPVEIVDRVNRANQIVKSTRSANVRDARRRRLWAYMVRAALDVAAAELDEAKVLPGKMLRSLEAN